MTRRATGPWPVIALGLLALLVPLIVWLVRDTADREAERESARVAADAARIGELQPGECITGSAPPATEVRCAAPHSGEVHAIVYDAAPAGTPVTAAPERSTATCRRLWARYAADPARPVAHQVVPPTAEQWDAGARRVACLAGDPGGGTTSGSAAAFGWSEQTERARAAVLAAPDLPPGWVTGDPDPEVDDLGEVLGRCLVVAAPDSPGWAASVERVQLPPGDGTMTSVAFLRPGPAGLDVVTDEAVRCVAAGLRGDVTAPPAVAGAEATAVLDVGGEPLALRARAAGRTVVVLAASGPAEVTGPLAGDVLARLTARALP